MEIKASVAIDRWNCNPCDALKGLTHRPQIVYLFAKGINYTVLFYAIKQNLEIISSFMLFAFSFFLSSVSLLSSKIYVSTLSSR